MEPPDSPTVRIKDQGLIPVWVGYPDTGITWFIRKPKISGTLFHNFGKFWKFRKTPVYGKIVKRNLQFSRNVLEFRKFPVSIL